MKRRGALGSREVKDLVRARGFSCRGCGACCRGEQSAGPLVYISHAEVGKIMDYTGLTFEQIAEPYPDVIITPEGGACSPGWCIRRYGDHCSFLHAGRCDIYPVRPWICRTYPFMMDGARMEVSECPGIGEQMDEGVAWEIARDLVARQAAEEADDEEFRKIYHATQIPRGTYVVIDSEGVTGFHG